MKSPETLPFLPIIEAETSFDLVKQHPQQVIALLDGVCRIAGSWSLRLGDGIAKAWLNKADNPYGPELAQINAFLKHPGVYALNSSYEWLCTTGVAPAPEGGMRMIRVLDWRMSGLGKATVLAKQKGRAGPYINVTWPGFVGILTAMAPGRFSAAINQAPIRSWPSIPPGLTLPFDWMRGRYAVWHSTTLPPAHLLRRVFDECSSYSEAKRMLMETPLCIPAFFCLAGVKEGEGCVIERTEHACAVREAPAAVANHWGSLPLYGRPRGGHSHERQHNLETLLASGLKDLCPALTFPVVNEKTRLIVAANPSQGTLAAQGWEKTGPVTALTSV